MGSGQSTEKTSDAPLSSRFSSMELKKLEEFFNFEELASKTSGKRGDNVQKRIESCFSENLAQKILTYLNGLLSVDQKVTSGDDVSENFLLLIFHLTKDCIKELSEIVFHVASQRDDILTKSCLVQFLTEFINCLMKGVTMNSKIHFEADTESSRKLAEKLVKYSPVKINADDFDVVLHRTPLLIDILQFKFRMVFFDYIGDISEDMRGSMPFLVPELEIKCTNATSATLILSLSSMISINSQVPMGLQHKWRLLYSTRLHGESFSKLTSAIVAKGPTVLVIKDSDGHVFGGFASESWQYSSKFQGNDKSFLFSSEPDLEIYDCLSGSYNDHYMYMNIGQETMPNGLGMGGQFDFFGLWIDQDFGIGHSRAKPLCTTFKSPQLSKKENFKIEAINIWGIGEEKKTVQDEEFDEEMTSVLDKHVEMRALLEIAGKPRVSEGLRDDDVDSDIPEIKELQRAHDPMS